jgi:hypothetical protein
MENTIHSRLVHFSPAYKAFQNKNDKEVRKTTIVLALFIGAVFFLLPILIYQDIPSLWPLWVSLSLILFSFLFPNKLKIVLSYWVIFGELLGHINSKIILFFVYYFVLCPISLFVKKRKDFKFQKQSFQSYFISVPKTENHDRIQQMKKPF